MSTRHTATHVQEPRTAPTRRLTWAVAAAGVSSFALLYAPQPLLPQLAARFGLDPGGASLAVSVATGALAIAVLPIAVASEVLGRRPVIVASVVSSVVLGILLPFAPSYSLLLVLRALQGIAIAGFPGVAAAYLAEQLPRIGVTAAVGAMIAGNTLGGMLGRLASGFSTDWLGWRGALGAVTGISLLCAVLAVLLLAGQRSPGPRAAGVQVRDVLAGLTAAVRYPLLLALYTVALLAMGSFVALYNAAGFRLTSAPLHLAPAIASLVFLAYGMGAVSSSLAARLVARFGRLRTLITALCLTGLGASLSVPDSLALVITGFVVLTAGFFAAHAVANGWVAVVAPAEGRGQVSGLYTLAYYLGSSIGGTAGSFIYGHAGWSWLIAATVSWLAFAVCGVSLAGRRAATATG